MLPGLINAHAHLFADGTLLPPLLTRPATVNLVAGFMRSFVGNAMIRRRIRTNLTTQLHSGVTTLRSVGDVAYEVVEARAAIERHELVGPRILASGPLMAITGGHGARRSL
ncbi:amidohydrolase family protein [Tessaracoccus coleopterorum]|uniref:amidohydrolase family protein n=1 Tax=Tessaracoccus coleopterorum TaxID=2714950 RepID=UPI002F90CCD1